MKLSSVFASSAVSVFSFSVSLFLVSIPESRFAEPPVNEPPAFMT